MLGGFLVAYPISPQNGSIHHSLVAHTNTWRNTPSPCGPASHVKTNNEAAHAPLGTPLRLRTIVPLLSSFPFLLYK